MDKLHGFGKKAVKIAHLLNIKTVGDLLTYFPFRYNDYQSNDLSQVPDKAKVSLVGRVYNQLNRTYHGRRNVTTFKLAYDHEHKLINISFFNKPWMIYKIHQNDKVLVYGSYQNNGYWYSINGNRVQKINDKTKQSAIVKPIYPSSHHIKQYTIQKLIKSGYQQAKDLIHNIVPKAIRKRYRLEDEATVVHDMHFPKSVRAERLAQRTAKFNELYNYELRIEKMKRDQKKHPGISIQYDPKVLRSFYNSIPFSLTSGQIRSIREIVLNLKAPVQMNRLLQGDVGSGKTIVAAFGILAAISAGYQAAIMIPTSVLGEQHYKSFKKLFKGMDIKITLLTSDMKPKAKTRIDRRISKGKSDLVIGTDALIQPSVKFKKLGLAVIDEQHKFGVDQRRALIDKGRGVNALAMTATPIPRTLAITSYGDMDVSIIDTLPQGRKPIQTKWLRTKQFKNEVPKIRKLLSKGQQAYCVVPLVKQTGKTKTDQLDAITTYYELKKLFAPYSVGLLHGQMDDNRKDQVLADFKSNKISLLVSTTVVEVGVDASNATMMIIFNADGFGLAQLHQLRGRVGRNSLQSYCLLVADPKTPNGVKRMQVMENTDDGFVVSNYDLKLRGGGDVFSSQQSGVPQFKVADAVSDSIILKYARLEAHKSVYQH